MQPNYISVLKTVIAAMILTITGCQDLTEINKNPNALTDDKVDPAYVLASVISGSASRLADLSFTGNVTQCVIPEAMQYTQRDYLEYTVTNQFGWYSLSFDYRNLHSPLANARYLQSRAENNPDSLFIKGSSLVMQALWFGIQTSLWGDIPYSEGYKGTENLQPVYDSQMSVFAGILHDLEKANDYLAGAPAVNSSVMKQSDLLYDGDITKWRQFANSLRLRYLMRLSEKTAEMKTAGVDVIADFSKIVSDPARFPVMTNASDDASLNFPGNNTVDSWPNGPTITPNESEFHRIKASATLIEYLKQRQDPRLTVWFSPVSVRTLVSKNNAEDAIVLESDGTVNRYIKSYKEGIDTSLYVGLKIALANPDIYNDNNAAQLAAAAALKSDIYKGGAANPFVSYLSPMYRANSHPLVKSIFLSAAETNFILAEAAQRKWISGEAQHYFVNGINASLDQYGIADGDAKAYHQHTHKLVAFRKPDFINQLTAELASASDPLEVIMQQKWLAGFTTLEGWFDWRRTGYPRIEGNILNGSQGQKIPVRYIYGENELNYNYSHTNEAVSGLSPATNDQWSKMWLLQGTGQPW